MITSGLRKRERERDREREGGREIEAACHSRHLWVVKLVSQSSMANQTQRGLMTCDLFGKAGTIARLMNSDKAGM